MIKFQSDDSISITVGHGYVQGVRMMDGRKCWAIPGGTIMLSRDIAEDIATRMDRLINSGLRRRSRS